MVPGTFALFVSFARLFAKKGGVIFSKVCKNRKMNGGKRGGGEVNLLLLAKNAHNQQKAVCLTARLN
jgi:hypothetical protein